MKKYIIGSAIGLLGTILGIVSGILTMSNAKQETENAINEAFKQRGL